MISINRTMACTCCWRVSVGTLTQTAAYTAFDKHNHDISSLKLTRVYFNIASHAVMPVSADLRHAAAWRG